MTHSRKKHPSHGIACGSNAQWKRDVRKLWRTRNRRLLRSLLQGNIHPDELQMLDKAYHNSDRWDEPTDGRVVIFRPGGRYTKEMVERFKRK